MRSERGLDAVNRCFQRGMVRAVGGSQDNAGWNHVIAGLVRVAHRNLGCRHGQYSVAVVDGVDE